MNASEPPRDRAELPAYRRAEEISLEAAGLSQCAQEDPVAYWQDVHRWIRSPEAYRAAHGNWIAAALFQFEDPQRAVNHLEEARRLFVSEGYYRDALSVLAFMAVLYQKELDDPEQIRLCRQLWYDYRDAADRFDPVPPDIMDDVES